MCHLLLSFVLSFVRRGLATCLASITNHLGSASWWSPLSSFSFCLLLTCFSILCRGLAACLALVAVLLRLQSFRAQLPGSLLFPPFGCCLFSFAFCGLLSSRQGPGDMLDFCCSPSGLSFWVVFFLSLLFFI